MKYHVRETFCIAVALAFAFNMFHPAAAPAADKRQALQELSEAFAEIAGEAGKMVVAIEAEPSEKRVRQQERSWTPYEIPQRDGKYRYFFHDPNWESGNREFHPLPGPHFPQNLPDSGGFGSGILLDDEGHIATVVQLVDNSNEITVTLENSTRFEAELIGADKGTGIAVIKINSDAIPNAMIGDSEQVAIGELALNLGHSRAGELSVALGVISGTGRQLPTVEYDNLIEISTNLRSRSGGGAVVNASGEVIGMSFAPSPDGAFAIPIRTVRRIATELIEHGKVKRGWLGVQIHGVNSEMAEELDLETPRGAIIGRILEDSPAAKAGLKRKDVIVAVDDEAIMNVKHLRHVIAMAKPHSKVSVTVMREGEKLDIPVTLSERTDAAVRDSFKHHGKSQTGWKGLSLQTLTESLADAFGYEPHEGVLIAGVEPGSPAAEAGNAEEKLRKGDLILEVENQPIQNVGAFEAAVRSDKEPVLLRVKRGEQVWYVTVK
jgi:serine protease Do